MYGTEQYFIAFIWIIAFLMISISVGLICNRFLAPLCDHLVGVTLGMGLTPYLIGGFMLIISFAPGPYILRRLLAMFLPIVFSIVVIAKNIQVIRRLIGRLYEGIRANKIIAFMTIGLILCFSFCVFSTISGVIRDTDIGLYTAEALYFDRTLSYDRIATSQDFIPYLNGSPHNFIWPAYISYPLLFTRGEIGFGNDLPMFLAIRILPILLMVVLMATVYLATRKSISTLIITALYILIPLNANLLCSYSRTTFRIIPVVILIALLIIFIQNTNKQFRIGYYILLGTVMYAIPSGHAINVFPTTIIALVWIIYPVRMRYKWIEWLRLAFPVTIGGIIGSYNFIYNFFFTGTFGGRSSLYCEYIWDGTDLDDIYLDYMNGTVINTSASFFETVDAIFPRDKIHLLIVCFGFSLVFFLYVLVKKKVDNGDVSIVLMYLLSVLTIIVGKYVGWSEFTYDEWISRNSSYTYHYYVFEVLAFAIVLTYIIYYVTMRLNSGKAISLTLFIIIAVSTFVAGVLPSYSELKSRRDIDLETYKAAIIPMQDVISKSESNKRHTLITEARFTYDLGVKAYMLTSYFGMPLFSAESANEIREFLKDNKIQFLCFEHTWWKLFYRHSNFYQILINMDDIKEVNSNGDVIIYEFLE